MLSQRSLKLISCFKICFSFCHSDWVTFIILSSRFLIQFSSVTQSCLTLCNPMDYSTPGFPVHHQHPELTQTHVHQVIDAIRLSHPPPSPSPLTFNLSQHQGLFKRVSALHQVAKVLRVSVSASVLPVNIQDSFPSG